jgi:hypothetical protein
MLRDLVAAPGDVRLLGRDLESGLGFDKVEDHPVDHLDLEAARFSELLYDRGAC